MVSCMGTTRGADEASDTVEACDGMFGGDDNVALVVAADMAPACTESGGVGICFDWPTEEEVV